MLSVAMAVAAMAMLGYGADKPSCDGYLFESARWIDAGGAHPSAQRQEGVALARCGQLIGRTDEQVVEMLGSPPVEFGSDHWRYWIGPATDLSDSGALEVYLRRGRVVFASAY